MKVEKSYAQMSDFDAAATNYLIKNGYIDVVGREHTFNEKANSKVSHALKNVIKQIGKHYEVINDELDSLRINHAATDDKNILLPKDKDGQFPFKPEKLIALKNAIKKYRNETFFPIYQRIQTEGIENFTEEEKEAFAGFIIPELEKETEA